MIRSAGIIEGAAFLRRTPTRPASPHRQGSFERWAAARPDEVALVYGHQTICYGELNRRASVLAEVLAKLGLSPGELVAVALDRSPETVAAMLAVLKAGGVFLPLDVGYPAARLEFMLDDARPSFSISDQGLLDRVPLTGQRIVWRERQGLIVVGREYERRSEQPAAALSQSSLAYAIYTSGSTGQPKAALLTHAGLAKLIAAERRLLQLGPGRRVLQFASPAFDAAVWEIFGALASGATLVLADAEDLLPGERLRETLERQRVDTLTLPPSALSMLGSPDLPLVKTLVVAGEACSAALASQWSVGRRFINAYGPTEATVCATAHLCPQGEQPAPPLGKALPHVELLVLDSGLRPVARGEPGELCLAGPCLALGYLNRPELTAEKFIGHPLVRYPDGRLYRTGDLVRCRPDGKLEFLGRTDRQVKIRGVRIEPDEITAVLERHQTVQAAVTVAVPDGGAVRLASFAIPVAGCELSAADLRAWLHPRLPAAMIPSSLTLIDRWPLSPNGKLDERALLSLEVAKARPSASRFSQAGRAISISRELTPGTNCERAVADLFQHLLHLPDVGANDDFFELGGDSLRAAELLARVEQTFGRRLSLGQFVVHSTARRLARLLDRTRPTKHSTIVPLTRDDRAADPWFFVHPAGGSAACYRRLAQAIGCGFSCFGIESPALAGDEPLLATIEAMAERYVDDILQVRPRGPYLLAGWSLGGLVAYEMAHRLRCAGYAVPALVLIDSGVLYSFELLRRFVPTDDVPAFLWKTADRERMYARLRQHEGRRLLPDIPDERLARRMFETFWANVEAAYHYSSPDDEGPLTLVVGADAQGKHHPYREWRRRCETIEVHELPARHLDLLESPFVEQLASILRSSIHQTMMSETSA